MKRIPQQQADMIRFIESNGKRFRREWLAYARGLEDTITQARIEYVIATKELPNDWAIELHNALVQYAEVVMARHLEQMVEHEGQAMMARIIRAIKSFLPHSQRVRAFIQREGANLVVEVGEEQRDAIKGAIEEAAGRNYSPTAIERRIEQTIGLTSQEASYVNRHADSLVEEDVPASRIDAMVDKYADILLKNRAERIARTECVRAYHAADQEAVMQAIDDGIIRSATKTWRTVGDDRVRDSHAEMEGRTVGIDEDFIGPDGYNYGPYPAEINERCWVETHVEEMMEELPNAS